MKNPVNYRVEKFSTIRRIIAATTSVGRQQNNIQALLEVDITDALNIIQDHRDKTGEKLSLTAYVATCLAKTTEEYPQFNAFRKGNKLILLEDVTVSVLVEREIDGALFPESLGIQTAQKKSYRQINDEIRAAQKTGRDSMGGLSDARWVRFIPGFLFRSFVRLASRSTRMMARYGAIGITAVGMFAKKNQPLWLIPLVGGATVAVAVGSIVQRPALREGGLENREYLCLTATFNHDIIDGAPAARFMKRFSQLLISAELMRHGM